MTLKRKYSSVHTTSTQTSITPFSEQRYHMGAKQSTQATPKRKKSSQQLQYSNSFQTTVGTAHASPQSLASLSKKPSLHGSFYSEYVSTSHCSVSSAFLLSRNTANNRSLLPVLYCLTDVIVYLLHSPF
jgi:hypothetical protein